MSSPLGSHNALTFSHMCFYVRDSQRMARFYRDALGFLQTDHGNLGAVELIFLSRDPSEYHQIVLASGRPTDLTFSVSNQISLRVPDLATLRELRNRTVAEPASQRYF